MIKQLSNMSVMIGTVFVVGQDAEILSRRAHIQRSKLDT